MNPILIKLRTIAQRVAEVLAEDTRVSAILLFGSAAYGVVSDTSDIDLEVLCKPHILSPEDRLEILSEIAQGWKIDKYGSENSLFPTVDVHEDFSGIKVEVHYQTTVWMEGVIESVMRCGTTSMESCPERPYTVPGMIQRALALYDRDSEIEKWREMVQEYPEALRKNIIAEGILEIKEHISRVESAKDDGSDQKENRENWRLMRGALDAASNVLLAMNRMHHPGEKRLERTVLPQLSDVPDRLVERWTLASPLGSNTPWKERVHVYSGLARDIIKMVD